ncbi:MAG TPA: DUF1622 domain-containing protein [Chloroflexota bacterium]|nr:DUF1622 domain-containing protein [Chloroflexota bacterium]
MPRIRRIGIQTALSSAMHLLLVANTLSGLPIDRYLTVILEFAVFVADLAGGIVVLVAAVRGLLTYLLDLLKLRGGEIPKEGIRLSLGRSFALALEFQVGADIISTALHPQERELLVLGGVILLRTLLNFFLERELRQAEKRRLAANQA